MTVELEKMVTDLCNESRVYRERIEDLEKQLSSLRDQRRWELYLAVLNALIIKFDVGALIHSGKSLDGHAKKFVAQVMDDE